MKRILGGVAAAALALSIAGCSGSSGNDPEPSDSILTGVPAPSESILTGVPAPTEE
jgi:Flp pilus assembly protein TadD